MIHCHKMVDATTANKPTASVISDYSSGTSNGRKQQGRRQQRPRTSVRKNMFSQSKTPTPSFALNSPMSEKVRAEKQGKPLSAAEQYQQAVVKANVFVEDSRARVQKSMESHGAVVNSNMWFYGYFGASMCATMAGCLSIGGRIPFFRSYCGWFALLGGYAGGKTCMNIHSHYLLSNVIKQVDQEIADARRLDEQTNSIVPDYKREVDRLQNVKYELMPTLPEAVAARANQKELSIEDKTDALVEAYNKRKEALKKK